MGFRNFGRTQLGKYSANFNWEGAVKQPLQGLVNVLLDLSKYFMYELANILCMNFITNTLKENMMLNCYLQTQTV